MHEHLEETMDEHANDELVLIKKAFGLWVVNAAIMLTTIFALIGTAFYFSDKAACARLKASDE